jgi:hypothetical protein
MNVRVRALDEVAASIADCRNQRNLLNIEEKGLKQTALQLMQKHLKTVWKHAGVELVRVPGEERLAVRLVKGDGDVDQDTAPAKPPAEVEEEAEVGEAQEPFAQDPNAEADSESTLH